LGHGESKSLHKKGNHRAMLDPLGGGIAVHNSPDSWEGFHYGTPHMWGMLAAHGMPYNDNKLQDVLDNCELLISAGGDVNKTAPTFASQWIVRPMFWLKKVGIQLIAVGPDLDYTACHLADKWIPTLPNTDAALWEAIAYVWITNGTYDQEYVDTHTTGFDKFKDYILGKEDGVAKTPEWAAPLCGVPSRTIKALARKWAAKRTSTFRPTGGAYIRGPYSHEPARFEACLLTMQGQGKPGISMFIWGTWAGYFYPNPMAAPTGGGASPTSAKVTPQRVARDLIPDAIINPPIEWMDPTNQTTQTTVRYMFPGKYTPGESNTVTPGYPEIKMIWDQACSYLARMQCGNRFIQAVRTPGKVEFFVAQDPWLEDNALFADVVLPVTTLLETTDVNGANGESVSCWYRQEKCIEPVGESMSDFQITSAIAQRLDTIMPGYDLLNKFTGGRTEEEWLKLGFDKSGLADLAKKGVPAGFPEVPPDFDSLKQVGYYLVPWDPNWKSRTVGGPWDAFFKDPSDPKGQLTTPSGKIEFYAETLAKAFPDDKERPPLPHWGVAPYAPFGKTHDEWRLNKEGRAQQYPLVVMTQHPRWRQHVMNDDISWSREIETCKVRGPDGYQYEPVWIHPNDANPRGLKTGDIVQVWNDRGKLLGGAYVTERIIPGAVLMDHGARIDPINLPDDPSKYGETIDRAGSNNCINPGKGNSVNCQNSGCWSSFLVEVKKADMADLMAKYPAAFTRPVDPDAGPTRDGWVRS
jgi:molybdopterin guanine dinucleotide-containing S/N-oxide reductase-like protein